MITAAVTIDAAKSSRRKFQRASAGPSWLLINQRVPHCIEVRGYAARRKTAGRAAVVAHRTGKVRHDHKIACTHISDRAGFHFNGRRADRPTERQWKLRVFRGWIGVVFAGGNLDHVIGRLAPCDGPRARAGVVRTSTKDNVFVWIDIDTVAVRHIVGHRTGRGHRRRVVDRATTFRRFPDDG